MSESPTSALWRTKTRHSIVIWSLQASEWFVTGQRQSFNLATWSCRSIRVTSITKQNYLGNAKAGTMDPTLPMMQLALGLQLFNATIRKSHVTSSLLLSELPPETQKTSYSCFHSLSRSSHFRDVSVNLRQGANHTQTCSKNGNVLLITWFHDLIKMNPGGGEWFTVVFCQFSLISKGFNRQQCPKHYCQSTNVKFVHIFGQNTLNTENNW